MRAARALFWLQMGNRLITAEVARLCEMDWDSAEYMLSNMSLVVPITEDDSKRWYWSGPPLFAPGDNS